MGQRGELGKTDLRHLLSSPVPVRPEHSSLHSNTRTHEIHVKQVRKALEMETWRDYPGRYDAYQEVNQTYQTVFAMAQSR